MPLSFMPLSMMLCLLLAVGPAKQCRADAQPDAQPSEGRLTQLSLEQLGNTEVTTVSKQPVRITRTPAAIYVLTQEDIRRSGATSIPEALRLVPGVEVSRIDSNKWSVGVRGFESRLSRSVLVLIDGRSVYTPLFAGVYWEVQDTLLEDIDRIEVIRGPGGTIWGPNAVNGVINIITKNAKDTRGTLVSSGGGNVDQGTGDARFGSGNGKNFNYRIYGKGFSRGLEFHPDRGGLTIGEWARAGSARTGTHLRAIRLRCRAIFTAGMLERAWVSRLIPHLTRPRSSGMPSFRAATCSAAGSVPWITAPALKYRLITTGRAGMTSASARTGTRST
jgi:outer membrane receptor protein involved in Fe transport